jgi:amino acid adenylation domain-containing protein
MTLIFDPLAGHAERAPEHTAVLYRQQRLSYGALESESNRLAHLLRAHGTAPGDRVCLAIPKSPTAVMAAIGILKAGAICVPLDLQSPAPRIASVIAQCEPRVVLGCAATSALLESLVAERSGRPEFILGWLDDAAAPVPVGFRASDLASVVSTRLDPARREEDCAYVLFTSGTTGRPKGVMVTHAGILRFNEWATRHFAMTAADRVSGNFALNFDPSLFDIYATLMSGATLVQVPPELHLLPLALAEFIRSAELTLWWSVPAVLSYLVKFDAVRQDDFRTLTRMLWAGEVCPTPVLRHLMQRLPHATFTNLYGPTEASLCSTYHQVPAIPASDDEDIPIGVACPGEEVAVLDEELIPVPEGTVGELHISGVGLTLGYWRNDAETTRAFVHKDGKRWYKTGDLGRIDQGLVRYRGRLDSQVKVRGYRIELGEIEAVAAGLAVDGLEEVCIVAISGRDGTLICCAYAAREGQTVALDLMRGKLAERLPPYMLPARWRAYAQLPRNGNGKLDRPRLKSDFAEQETMTASGGR